MMVPQTQYDNLNYHYRADLRCQVSEYNNVDVLTKIERARNEEKIENTDGSYH